MGTAGQGKWLCEHFHVDYQPVPHISRCSSVGRARGLGPRGPGFETLHLDQGVVTSPSFGFNSMGQIARMVSVSLHKGQGSSPPWSAPTFAGVVQWLVHQPSKLRMWVRLPSPAPYPWIPRQPANRRVIGKCGFDSRSRGRIRAWRNWQTRRI